jgi:hypothetical protein
VNSASDLNQKGLQHVNVLQQASLARTAQSVMSVFTELGMTTMPPYATRAPQDFIKTKMDKLPAFLAFREGHNIEYTRASVIFVALGSSPTTRS